MDAAEEVTWLRHYAEQVAEASEDREDAIRRCRKAGMSLRAIAEAAGLSHTQIANIVNRNGKRPPAG